VLKKVVQH